MFAGFLTPPRVHCHTWQGGILGMLKLVGLVESAAVSGVFFTIGGN